MIDLGGMDKVTKVRRKLAADKSIDDLQQIRLMVFNLYSRDRYPAAIRLHVETTAKSLRRYLEKKIGKPCS